MSHLSGVTLSILMLICRNASSGRLQLYLLSLFILCSYLHLFTRTSDVTQFKSQKAPSLWSFYSIRPFIRSKFCPVLIYDISSEPICNFRNFTLYSVTCKNYPSTRPAVAENLMCNDINMFSKHNIILNLIYNSSMYHWSCCYNYSADLALILSQTTKILFSVVCVFYLCNLYCGYFVLVLLLAFALFS